MGRSLRDRLAALDGSAPASAWRERPADSPQQTGASQQMGVDAAAGKVQALVQLGFARRSGPLGCCWARTLTTDLLTRHGSSRFADLLMADLSALARAAKLAQTPAIYNLRFYDTETSGLGIGAGTFPFLHAVGWIAADEWRIDQYFLADHADEPALLATLVADHFPGGQVVVTFNGRTFDWPLLQNRLILHRLPAVSVSGQIDLLQPSRRLWKASLGSVSLTHLERELLHLQRLDDLPGREAPARFFSFLERPEAAAMATVLNHNALDVCSLSALLTLTADVLGKRRSAVTAGEYLALARWHDEWQETELALTCLEAATTCPDADWRAFWLLSLSHKRRGDWAQACAVWQRMVALFPTSVAPLVELAKSAEHRQRDFAAAIRWTDEALRRASASTADGHGGRVDGGRVDSGPADSGISALLRARLARVQRKAAAVRSLQASDDRCDRT